MFCDSTIGFCGDTRWRARRPSTRPDDKGALGSADPQRVDRASAYAKARRGKNTISSATIQEEKMVQREDGEQTSDDVREEQLDEAGRDSFPASDPPSQAAPIGDEKPDEISTKE